ncbi:hypothetical protein BDV27DRAFT_157120 [Aspergillus caelatus]|uniref:Uncharacterized protein n=1 Tax=Aspergillus caelatus TaxID=61420 RepID=A0A5N7A5R9_9EURO|nr:uncharacterized protein BDV27DRAFT_157120 [Aspergillus caelatus]KAE8365207.1 hypothetical protein BDV27DRAFT_157120 [Aspergillus caelatus]
MWRKSGLRHDADIGKRVMNSGRNDLTFGYERESVYPRDEPVPNLAEGSANDRSQEMMIFDWELPSVLQRLSSGTDDPVGRYPGSNSITLSAKGDYVEMMTCQQYRKSFHPDRGVKLVEVIINALSSPSDINGRSSKMDPQVKDIAVWLYLTFRTPTKGGTVMDSTGSFDGTHFTMSKAPMSSPACWSKLFEDAAVVVMPGKIFSGGLLKMSFGTMIQVAAVKYPIGVDKGLVLMGYSTALVPIDTNAKGQVIWHLEVAFMIGSFGLKVDMRWPDVKVRPTTEQLEGANLQLLAQSAAFIQIEI